MLATTGRRVLAAVAVPLMMLVSAGVLTACQPGADCDPAIFRDEANLSGQDLHGYQLQQCNMRRMGFAGANLRGADVSNAIMTNTDLKGTDFTGAELNQTDLRGAQVEGALLDADLYFVHSGALNGTPAALPAGWTVENGHLVGPSANLTGASFANLDWSGRDLRVALFNDAELADMDLAGADFTKANFTGTIIRNSDLTGAIGPGNATVGAGGAVFDNVTCSDGFVTGPGDTCAGHGTGW